MTRKIKIVRNQNVVSLKAETSTAVSTPEEGTLPHNTEFSATPRGSQNQRSDSSAGSSVSPSQAEGTVRNADSKVKLKTRRRAAGTRRTRVLRRSYIDMVLEEDPERDDGEGGEGGGGGGWPTTSDDDGARELKPDGDIEYEQRLDRRKGEAQYGSHVREARDPSDVPDQDMGMGAGLQGHPLLSEAPLGSQATIEQINAAENDAAKMELKRKLENQKRAEHHSTPSPTAH